MKTFRVTLDLDLDELIKLERWFHEAHRNWSSNSQRNFREGDDSHIDSLLNKMTTAIAKPVVIA